MALSKTKTSLPVATPGKTETEHLQGPEMKEIVDLYFSASAAAAEATANLETAKIELTETAFSSWVKAKGSANNVVFNATDGREVIVSLKDAYSGLPESALDSIKGVIGEANADRLFTYEETLKVDVSAIPEDKREEFVKAVEAVCANMGIPGVAKIAQVIKPIKGAFHAQRHVLLTPEQNRQLQPVVKTVISVAERRTKKA